MKFRHPLIFVSYLFFFATGFAHAANLVAVNDNYGIPSDKFLQVEAPGVLSNDTLDGQNVGNNNAVTAVLVSSVSNGTLACPGNPGVELCTDGSFEYTANPEFSGTDSFTYQAAFGGGVSTPATVTLSACNGGPTVFTCWHETPYRVKLSELGYNNLFIESFEGAPWDIVRSSFTVSNVAQSILSKGISWETNHPGTNNITTGPGPARTGLWGGYDPDHGFATGTFAECDIDNPPIHCRPHDGLSGKIQPGGAKLYAVGGYISALPNASIAIILDGTTHNVGKLPGGGHYFFGVIDAAGFNGFEFQEQGGKVGQEKFIFFDDVLIASSGLVDVNNPPVLVLLDDLFPDPQPVVVSPLTVNEGDLVRVLLTASDPDDGDFWSFSVSGAPAGSSLDDNFDGTATFSWRPDFDQATEYPLTFTVTDNGIPEASASESITITVVDVNRPPVLSPIGDQSVNENTLLSILLTASDPDGNALSFVVDTLPTGSSFVDNLDGTATFSWTPVPGQAADYPLNLTVSDDGVPVASDSEAIIITVIGPTIPINSAPVITSTAIITATENVAYSYTLTATDADGDSLIYSDQSNPALPAWISFNPTTHVLSGTPGNADVSSFNVVLRVSDGTVNTDQSFSVTVADVNNAPVITSTAIITATENVAYSYTLTATDADGDTLIYSDQSNPALPAWISFNTTTHVLSGTPGNADVSSFNVVLRVSDGTVNTDQSFSVTVADVNNAPVITSTAITTATENVAYSYTLTATDADGDTLIYSDQSNPALPAWISFNPTTQVLSGTPGNGDVGTINVVLRVSDGTVNTDQSFSITVADVNNAPVITSTAITTATENVAYSYTLTATDADGDTLIYSDQSNPALPAWISFNPTTHVLSGTPGNGDVGTIDVLLRVTDGTVNTDQSFSVTVADVNNAPVITSTAITTATENVAYSYTLTATDADGDSLIYSDQSNPVLPAWISFNPTTHVLSGTPGNADVSSFNVVLRVTDGTVNTDQSFSVTVGDVNNAPVITSTAITTATENVAYSYTLTATDADGDSLIYSDQSNPVLPAWISFNPTTHVLSGTPGNGDVGTIDVLLRVTDGTVNTDQSFSVTVGDVNNAPVITSTAIITATENVAYSYTLTATDADGDSLIYSDQSNPALPAWISFNTTTHVLSGTPGNGDVGSFNVVLRVSDGTINTDQSFSVTVADVNNAPVITSTAITTATENVAYSYTLTATDADGDTLIYSDQSNPVLPAWISFNPTTHVLSGTPGNADVSSFNVVLRVSDGTVNTDQSFSVTVGDVNNAPVITSTAIITATENVAYSYTLTATDADGDSLIYSDQSNPALPAWISFNPTTQALSGTPGNADVSSFNVVLRVTDGTVNTDQSFSVTVGDVNNAPVANAGADQTALVSNTITLDGSGSTDVDGDALTYSWLLTSKPSGSTANLSNPNTINPSFVIDVPGDYVAQLIVNDGLVDGLPDTVNINTTNSAPVANAGADQAALVNNTVTLDGSGSTDTDGDALTYSWSLTTVPAGSSAKLSDPGAINPSFVIDSPGDYIAQLIVNDGLVDSTPDTVNISTSNSVPVANAGADQSTFVGNTVTLDGSGSTDADGDALTYSWSLTTVPAGSVASLSDPAAVNPSFVIDVPGDYVAQLIVHDGLVGSTPDTVNISTINSTPVANAGVDQSSFVGDMVTLDGSGSTDADGDVLTYSWSLTTVPADSAASLSDPGAINPSFVIDVPGDYIAQLIVNDGLVDSTPDTVNISTSNSAPVANAGADQSTFVGNTVTLDGSGSTDADADTLTYSWSFSSVPVGSTASLDITDPIYPTFTVDLSGAYEVQLIVNDGLVDSLPDTVNIIVDALVDTKPPVITPPPYIVVDAKGLLTNVDKNPNATAIDDVDGPVLVIPNRKGPFAPGRHEIIWTATDSSGNTATAIQIIDVNPLVEFVPDKLVLVGDTVKIRVLLNGNAPEPVNVAYVIDEAGTAVKTGTIEILSGTEGIIEYTVPGKIQFGDITFTFGSVTNAVQGPQNSLTLTVVNENIAPVAILEMTQNSVLTRVITVDGGPVNVSVTVNDANTTDSHSYDWSMTDNVLLPPNSGLSNFEIDPLVLGLTPGIYRLAVTVTDDGLPNLATAIDLLFAVVDTAPVLTNDDSDGDGVDDITEGIVDSDNDGIPDYLDAINNLAVIQGKKGITNGWLLNTQPGLSIRLGGISLYAANQTANVTAQEIKQHAGKSGSVVLAETIDTLTNAGGYFDFEIYGLSYPGQSVLIVIPQHSVIPDRAVYRKYSVVGGWEDFVEDSKNSLFSAPGEAGICPPPGDPAYIPGLTPGHHCVQLMIEDGGANDTNGENGVISDPGGVAVAAAVTDPVVVDPVVVDPVTVDTTVVNDVSSGGGGGGGSVDLITLILFISLGLYRRNLSVRRDGSYHVSR